MDQTTFNSLVSAPIAPRPTTTAVAATPKAKTVADPSAAYYSLAYLWLKSRAVCRGEQFVKDFDATIDVTNFGNLLIPFSPSMTPQQYQFYKAEAELPGITSQFSKSLVGGLLRKQPTLTLPESVPPEAHDWLIHEFGKDDSPMSAFLDEALWEEVQTSRAWIFIDHPEVPEGVDLDPDEALKYKPYPVLHRAENIINTRKKTDAYGKTILDRVIVKGYQEVYDNDEYEFHPNMVPTVWVHELNTSGYYQVRIFEADVSSAGVEIKGGQAKSNNDNQHPVYLLKKTTLVEVNGEPLEMIPAWPLNGSIDGAEPMLMAIIDKEIALYNKISRRNHLMYGAATYTPVISSNMTDEKFDEVVQGGLGTWLHLEQGDTADVLKTPTEALQDMEKAIAAGYEEIAKLGVRMLAPETGDQSGVALELRNATQSAQLGSLNTKVSNTMRQIIAFMINWKYDLELSIADIEFELSSDFNPMPQGVDWLRLATEWYQQGLIPRTSWLLLLKQNDMLPPDYDDNEGQAEVNQDDSVVTPREQFDNINQQYADQMKAAMTQGN